MKWNSNRRGSVYCVQNGRVVKKTNGRMLLCLLDRSSRRTGVADDNDSVTAIRNEHEKNRLQTMFTAVIVERPLYRLLVRWLTRVRAPLAQQNPSSAGISICYPNNKGNTNNSRVSPLALAWLRPITIKPQCYQRQI